MSVKSVKKVAFVDRSKEFFNDLAESMISTLQDAKRRKIGIGQAMGYGCGRPGKPGKEAKTIERETVVVRPTNFLTKKPYSGSNFNKFTMAVALNRYPTGWFGTYKQWETAGCKVIKGSKSWKGRTWLQPELSEKQQRENAAAIQRGEKEPHAQPDDHPTYFNVFNLAQVEAVTPEGAALIEELAKTLQVQVLKHVQFIPAIPSVEPTDFYGNPWYRIEELDNIALNCVKIKVNRKYKHGGYNTAMHVIQMPAMETGFKSSGHYYACLLHELAHSTGKALGRPMGPTPKGSAEYAKEELIAELAAWIMCVDLGIVVGDDDRSCAATYLDHWLEHISAKAEYLREVMVEVNKICYEIRKAIA